MKPTKWKLPGIPYFLLISVLLSVIQGCRSGKPQSSGQEDTMIPPNLQNIIGIGRIEPELKIVELAAEVRGIVENILISPGDMITEGESILHMNRDVEHAQVNQAKARMEAQRAVIHSILANLEATKIITANVKSNFDRFERLYQSGAETKAAYDDSRAAYESLLMETNRLEADILSARSFLKQAEADLNLAEIHLRQKMIIAPANGKLLSMDVTLGSLISPGDAIGSFAISSPLSAWCEIDELFAQRVQVDQKAYVRPEGMTDTLAVGIVTFAGPYLRRKSIFSDNTSSFEDRRIREVRIRLEPGTLLLYGQRVECVIQINQE